MPKGTKEKQRLVFEGEGHANRTSIPGDLVVTIKYRQVAGWVRRDNDLIYKMTINFEEAMLGFNRLISTYYMR